MVKKAAKGIALAMFILLIIVFLKIQFIGKEVDPSVFKPYLLQADSSHHVQLTYLGTSGFIIGYKGKQVVCDPYFSNPNLISGGLGKIDYPLLSSKTDSNLYQHVRLITISHGHYDHCLDIGNFLHPGSATRVIADSSILNELHSILSKNGVQEEAVRPGQSAWIYSNDSLFRTYPLSSKHNPHFGHTTLLTGNYTEPQPSLPRALWQWKLYHCTSFVIDILEQGNIYYRAVVINGRLDEKGVEALRSLSKERKADIMMPVFWNTKLCKGNTERYYGICRANTVLLQHWNNFFRSTDKSLQYLRPTGFPDVLDEFKEEKIPARIMMPFTTVEL